MRTLSGWAFIFISYISWKDLELMPLRGHKLAVHDCVVVLVVGALFNRHEWDPWASESREAIACFPSLPVPLFGDGRGETRVRQGTAAGRNEDGWLVKLQYCVLSDKVKQIKKCSSLQHPFLKLAKPLSSLTPLILAAKEAMRSNR